eukprot:scaffold2234_cov165-Amphora_coffeaeformis.AAC.1
MQLGIQLGIRDFAAVSNPCCDPRAESSHTMSSQTPTRWCHTQAVFLERVTTTGRRACHWPSHEYSFDDRGENLSPPLRYRANGFISTMRYPLIQSTDHLVLFLTLWLATTPPPSTAFLELPPVVARKKSLDESPNNVFRTQGALWLAGFGKKKKESRERNSSSSFSNVTIVGIDEPETSKRRRQRKQRSDEFEARRKAWEDKYGSADALCRTFGGCANPIWGDLDGEATRELYHTLLPRSLWALQEADILQPEELAPLAYQARVAAKEYARRRSTLPNRLLAMGFDGYRSWKRDGNPLNTKGLSWEDLWE